MGWLDRALGWLGIESRSITLADFPATLLNPPTAAGVPVTEKTAMEYAPFRNGVVLISSDVGKIPRHPYERKDDGSRERLDGGYLDRLLRQPNPYINDLDLWATTMVHALVCGDGYLEIEWDAALRPIALWPLLSNQMTPVLDGSRLRYRYQGQRLLDPEDFIHIKGPSFNGLKGDNTVELARQALGLGMASERFGASFFGNGAILGLILEHPGKLSKEAAERIRKSVDERHAGSSENWFRTLVAEEGMKANAVGLPLKESQFQELRDFQVVEIARILNIPPHKLKHKMGERPGANLTESEQDYLNGTLDPWLTKIEQECNLKLIPRAQRSHWYIEHDRNAYLRMTPEAKAASYKQYYDMKVLSSEQIAVKENLPKPDENAFPEPLKALPVPQKLLPAPRMLAAQRAAVVQLIAPFTRLEANAARRAAKKGAEAFGVWVRDFYGREAEVLRGCLLAGVELYLAQRGSEAHAGKVAQGLVDGYVERSREELLELRAQDLEEQVERLVERWALTRPLEMADKIAALGEEKNDAA